LQQQRTSWTKTVAPGEVIYAEGFSAEPVLYVIADGKVEISTQCDDKKVVVATLGKGEFFGEATLLGAEPRSNTAKALTFCQLTVIDTSVIDQELERVSPLLRHITRTMIRRSKKKDDLLATYTHADFLPGMVSYAHVLSLMAGNGGEDGRTWRARSDEVSVPLREVVKKCRAIAGHSRLHVMVMLKRMERFNLITLEASGLEGVSGQPGRRAGEEGAIDRQHVSFDPRRITDRAQLVADHELDLAVTSELELIELTDLEALIGVGKNLILNKLSRAEIAEDVFAFRKARVLHFVEEKGVSYFSRPERRAARELRSLDDLDVVDDRSLAEAVGGFDTYDMAKLLASLPQRAVTDRLLAAMSEARRKEVSWIMRRDIKTDPVEVANIEDRFVEAVRAIAGLPALASQAPDATSGS
jgi:CRP-like cAMP-binding protein